jgi:rhamnogalacturonyl hydrolase YesR
MILMAKEAVLRQGSDGRLAVISTANGINDSATPGEAVLRCAALLNDGQMKAAAERMLNYLLHDAPRTLDGYVHHSHHGPELWADSIYMSPPFLAYAGHPAEALKQLKGIRDRLWNSAEKLFAYRWNDERGEITHPNLWGLANAHAIAGMTKVAEYLPPGMEKERAEVIGWIIQHLDGCLRHMRSDYLFHNIINDPASFIETSLAMRVAYAIYIGIMGGWIGNEYLETANKIRNAVAKTINEFGFVMGVPGPPSYSTPGRSSEGQAFFLMMEAACEQYRNF